MSTGRRKKNAKPRCAECTLESAFGSVNAATRTRDFKAVSRSARDEKVNRELTGFDKLPGKPGGSSWR